MGVFSAGEKSAASSYLWWRGKGGRECGRSVATTQRSHADAQLRGYARGCDGGVRQVLAARV